MADTPEVPGHGFAGRGKFCEMPSGFYEIPGRPHMIYHVLDYPSAEKARLEIPFLFQAFEAGQMPPPAKKVSNKKRKLNGSSGDLLSSGDMDSANSSLPVPVPVESPAVQRTIPMSAAQKEAKAEEAARNETGNDCSTSETLHLPTIHEYLDWTVTAKCTRPNWEKDPELDFEGFRVITVCGRHRPAWPRPGESQANVNSLVNEQMKLPWMGETLPALALSSKAYSAATVRTGCGGRAGGKKKHFLEIPFFATAPSRRGKGFGRCLLDAIEIVCNMLEIDTMLLCSTNDPTTLAIWKKLGFISDEEAVKDCLADFGITLKSPGLLHMDNTVQLFKHVTRFTAQDFKRIRIMHKSHVQVQYYNPNIDGGEGGDDCGGEGSKQQPSDDVEATNNISGQGQE